MEGENAAELVGEHTHTHTHTHNLLCVWIFKKGARVLEQLYIHKQKINLDPYLTLYTKIYSRSIIDLNTNVKSLKHLKNIGEYLPGANKDFLEMTLKQSTREKKHILNFIKAKNFVIQKI